MPTKNPRLNITFDQAVLSTLASLAKQEKRSISNLAKELILEALAQREDLALSTIAEKRDTKTAKKVSHDNAWK